MGSGEAFLQKIFAFIQDRRMIARGDTVLAGVSGGADSMCLLAALRAYQEVEWFGLIAVHVEHGIRGSESLADAEYVRNFCEERGIRHEIVRVDAPAYASEHKISLEESARRLRYSAFDRLAAGFGQPAFGGVKIAVAHHREDQAETVLWQLIRGSDIKGLGGMRPARGTLIRPLLCADRGEIEAFLRREGISWREDATNLDRHFTRNRIRLDIMPELAGLNGAAVEHICIAAERLREADDYLEREADGLFDRHVVEMPGRWQISGELMGEPQIMQRRVLLRALSAACGGSRDLGAKHVALLQELFGLQAGRRLEMPGGVSAIRKYGGVELSRGDAGAKPLEISPDMLRLEVLCGRPLPEISKKKYTKCFDYDKIKSGVQIRTRMPGDYLTIDSAGHRQKLKDYMVNEKIPADERDHIPLLADGQHIMWVVGGRISEYYKVDENTRRMLWARLIGGNGDE